jgi:hypothetical protein
MKMLVTRPKVTAAGAPRIEARWGNDRKVIPFDPSQTLAQNHAEAAAVLVTALNLTQAVLLAFARGEVACEEDGEAFRFLL